VILVYDITDFPSFEALKSWYDRLQSTISSSAVFGIFANKQDLAESSQVEGQEAMNFARKINALYKKTSAKDNLGIAEGFGELCRLYLNNIGSYEHTDTFKVKHSYLLKKPQKRQCCR
jgi:GTPase SAR1 family protein